MTPSRFNTDIFKKTLFVMAIASAAVTSLHAQTLEKFQPADTGSGKYIYDISLPTPDRVESINVAVDGKPLADNGDLSRMFIDDVNNDYTCDVLFLVDKGAGGGVTTAGNDAKGFQETLKRIVDKALAKNRNRAVTRAQSTRTSTTATKIPPLFNIEIATIEDAAYEKLASLDSDQDKLVQATSAITLDSGSQQISLGVRNVIAEFQTMPGDRKYIVLVSSGRFSDHPTSLDDVIRAAKNANVKLCTIGFNDGRDDAGLNELVDLATETQGYSIASNHIALDGSYSVDEEKLDDLLAYMVSGSKGTVDLSGAHLPGTVRFTLNTTFGKTYVVNQKVDAAIAPATATTTPAATGTTTAPVASAPATNAPSASTNAPAVAAKAPATNAAPVLPTTGKSTTTAAPHGDILGWLTDEYQKEPTKVIGVAAAGLVLLIVLVVLALRLTQRPPQGRVTLPASPMTNYPPEPPSVPGNGSGAYTGDNGATQVAPGAEHGAAVMAWLDNLNDSSRYPIQSKSVRIGRKPDNDLVINNDSVSNYHAEIIKRDGRFVIVDRGSSNKVYIDGKPVHNVPLNEGEIIELGDIRLRFQSN